MYVMAKGKPPKTNGNQHLTRRLDAIIRLLLEIMYSMKDAKFNQGTAARSLNSVGLTPTEIATILGKKSPASIAKYLYGKKLRKGTRYARVFS